MANVSQQTPLSVHKRDPGEGTPGGLSERVRSLRLAAKSGSEGSRQVWPWVLCGLLACSTAVLGYLLLQGRISAGAAGETSKAENTKGVPSGDSAAVAAPGEIALEAKGYIIPVHEILISPKVSGVLVEMNIVEGTHVTEKDVLAVVEDTEYKADLLRAKASLVFAEQAYEELKRGFRPEEIAQSEAELAESDAQLKQLKDEWARSEELFKKNAFAQEDCEKARAKYQAMDRHVEKLKQSLELMRQGPRDERKEMARADVDRAKADLAKAQWRYDSCTIRPPVTGTILTKNAEKGNMVNPIAQQGSYSICKMADLSDLEVDLKIQERDVAKVFKGQKCKVRTEAYPDRVYNGHVSRLMPIADQGKGAIPVRVKIVIPKEEEGVYLKPEMGALVSFLNNPAKPKP
jgi:HlyD family secretion protein